MESNVNWNPETTLLLIELVRERPVIWDTSSKETKDKFKRAEAFSEVADIIGTSVNIVTTKWLSLRGQFKREKKKVCSADSLYKSKWFAYEQMARLVPYDITQNLTSNFEFIATPSPITRAQSESPAMTPISPSRPTSSPPPNKTRNTYDYMDLYTQAMTARKAIKELKMNDSSQDEISAFGTYVAAQMRKLRPILQSKLKLDIQTLLSRYEIENIEYEGPGSSMKDNADYYSDEQPPTPSSSTNNVYPHIKAKQLQPTSSTYHINSDTQPKITGSAHKKIKKRKT